MDLFARIDAVKKRWNVLEHPFYARWNEGELTPDELSHYAGQYRHAVVALAQAAEAHGDAEHAAEEAAHISLWDDFALAVEADLEAEPASETAECAAAWTAAGNSLEGLVVLYTIESAQPAISRTKLEGLLGHYGFEEGPATEYFELHSERDHEHAAQSRAQIEQRIDEADADRLVALAEHALRGNWTLLDGVERQFGR
jgi:pyrroloquinoline quinone (PQQ) biosynthesis protein C